MNLIETLIADGWLKTPRIIEAFRKIKREDFLPEEIKDLAELNEALSIGCGQTISQPLVVAFMLELLQPQSGDKILDVGSGSGWTAALLAEIVSGSAFVPTSGVGTTARQGRVIAIDIVSELVEFGKENVAKYNFIKSGIVEFICADGSKGYDKEAPYDKILVSAEAKELPMALKKQLKIGGIIVIPIGSSIWRFIKKSEKPSTRVKLGAGPVPHRKEISGAGDFGKEEYPGFAFVPLITNSK